MCRVSRLVSFPRPGNAASATAVSRRAVSACATTPGSVRSVRLTGLTRRGRCIPTVANGPSAHARRGRLGAFSIGCSGIHSSADAPATHPLAGAAVGAKGGEVGGCVEKSAVPLADEQRAFAVIESHHQGAVMGTAVMGTTRRS